MNPPRQRSSPMSEHNPSAQTRPSAQSPTPHATKGTAAAAGPVHSACKPPPGAYETASISVQPTPPPTAQPLPTPTRAPKVRTYASPRARAPDDTNDRLSSYLSHTSPPTPTRSSPQQHAATVATDDARRPSASALLPPASGARTVAGGAASLASKPPVVLLVPLRPSEGGRAHPTPNTQPLRPQVGRTTGATYASPLPPSPSLFLFPSAQCLVPSA